MSYLATHLLITDLKIFQIVYVLEYFNYSMILVLLFHVETMFMISTPQSTTESSTRLLYFPSIAQMNKEIKDENEDELLSPI